MSWAGVRREARRADRVLSRRLASIEKYNHNTSTFVRSVGLCAAGWSWFSGKTRLVEANRRRGLQTFDLPEGTTSGMTVASAVVLKSATEGQALGKNGKPAIKPYTPVYVRASLTC